MTRLAACALFFSATIAFAIEPNPARLKPSAEEMAKAQQLVKKLESDLFRERDQASRALAEMGRVALPVVVKTLAETTDAEVRDRCESLRPMMHQADVKARLEVFLADIDGKYDHKLPGWDKFHATVGNTTATRKLYGDMYAHAATARLLSLITGPKDEFQRAVSDRRMEMYNRMYGRRNFAINGVVNNVAERRPPEPAEVAGLLFTEGLIGSNLDRRTGYSINSMLLQAPTRDVLNDEVKGAPYRKLIGFWCDSRTESYELYLAMSLATSLNLKDLPPSRYALRVLESKVVAPMYYAYALTALAKGGKDQLPHIVKQFDNKTVMPTAFFANANGVSERVEIQIRDTALAFAIALTDQKPEDFGFKVTGRGITEVTKFAYNSYRLESDEKRAAAFKKWNESQKK